MNPLPENEVLIRKDDAHFVQERGLKLIGPHSRCIYYALQIAYPFSVEYRGRYLRGREGQYVLYSAQDGWMLPVDESFVSNYFLGKEDQKAA